MFVCLSVCTNAWSPYKTYQSLQDSMHMGLLECHVVVSCLTYLRTGLGSSSTSAINVEKFLAKSKQNSYAYTFLLFSLFLSGSVSKVKTSLIFF